MDIFDWLIKIFEIISIIVCFISLITKKDEYISNITIKHINDNSELDSLSLHYFDEFNEKNGIDYFIIYPKNTNFKNVTFYSLTYDMKKNKFDEKLIRTYSNITYGTGILILTTVPEGIPHLKVKWCTQEELTGEYIFDYNGYNGYTDIDSYCYHYSIIAKIKLFFKNKL